MEAKVEKALQDVVKKIKKAHPDKSIVIEKLTLDVFGFSRGAAGARNFIHKALFGEGDCLSILSRLVDELGYTVGQVEVCFVGLYDTVSSFGYLLPLNSNNTRALHLDAVANAKAVVHLAAADVHRKYFALTDIGSAAGKGRQYFLPGIHSDIGGGYRDNGTETQTIYRGFEFNAQAERARLIDAGWYTEKEITLNSSGDELLSVATLTVKRPNIGNGYSQIPLHLMAGYARESKINIISELESDEPVPAKLRQVHTKLQEYINAQGPYSSKAEDWHCNDLGWLRQLRHDYFHFSARLKMGHTPCFKRGQRSRQTHEG